MEENGTYATRAEVLAHITPLRNDVQEIKSDVKVLLAYRAGNEAVRVMKKGQIAALIGGAAIVATLTAAAITVIFG